VLALSIISILIVAGVLTILYRKSIKVRDEYTAVAVHDLKNPITTIKLYSANIKDEKVKKVLLRESDRLLFLVNQLLDYSKIQNNKFAIDIRNFNLNRLCYERIKIFKKIHPNHKFIFQSFRKNIRICADEMAMERIINNLLINAVKYSPENEPIKLVLKKTGNNGIIKIIDHGIGVLKKDQNSLFEPFYQAKNSKQGLGLGLFIVKSLVELHRGSITLHSKKNKGTIFVLSLPLKRQSAC
jgi:signal transduction histidine kinase